MSTFSRLISRIILPSICLLLLWSLGAFLVDSSLILPNVLEVFETLGKLLHTPIFYEHLLATTIRSLSAFVQSLFISILLGTLCGISSFAEDFFSFPMAIIKSAPVVSFILLALFWFTTDEVPVFVSILMTMPVLTSAVTSGIHSVDRKLLDMAQVYQFSLYKKIRYVYIPSVLPFFFAGSISAFGLSWKVVVAAEVLSLPKRAVGTALQTGKVHLETGEVFAVSIAVIVLSYVLETLFVLLIRKKQRKTHGNH